MNIDTDAIAKYAVQNPADVVEEFHDLFGHPIEDEIITPPVLDTDLARFRMRLVTEEYRETVDAFADKDLLGFIDGLQDLKYVIFGLELALGIYGQFHFAEVHLANMRKLGPDGRPMYRSDGKVMKPEGWTGPDHQGVLNELYSIASMFP